MLRTMGWVLSTALLVAATAPAAGPFEVKLAKNPPPEALKQPLREVLADQSIQLLDNGAVVIELWLRKQLPAKVTAEQVKNGLTYRDLEEGTLLGAVRFERTFSDYRKQKIAAGVYTLRLGFQPMDGDHMGTAPYNEFALLIPARIDDKATALETKELREMSSKAPRASHPGIMLLFPNDKPPSAPQLVDKGDGHWVLSYKADVVTNENQKTFLGFGLTVVGHTSAE